MNALALPTIKDARLPTTYVRAVTALEKCEHLDECKDWADKAAALASYGRQSKDEALLKTAIRIRARAVRRSGELIEAVESGRGAHLRRGGESPSLNRKTAAAAAGFSDDQRKQALRVAALSKEEFESQVESDKPPTASKLAKLGTVTPPHVIKQMKRDAKRPGFSEALYFIAALKRMADECEEHEPKFVAGGVVPHETKRAKAHATQVSKWLRAFASSLKE